MTVAPVPSAQLTQRVDAAIHAAEALTMDPIPNAGQLEHRLALLRRGRSDELLLCGLDGGLLAFVAAAFPGHATRGVCGKHCFREPQGRGAHFDVYGAILDAAFPWVAVFNIAGDALVRALRLPVSLAMKYSREHPEASAAAYDARRHAAAEALANPESPLCQGMLWRHSGLIIPQLKDGPHWVHDIVPLHADGPGQFIELLVPSQSSEALRELSLQGYTSLDQVITASLEMNSPARTDADASSLFGKRLLD